MPGDPRERIGFAYDGLCAWCSIPERRGAPHEEWQHRTDFAPLHEQFPKLVDEEGWGWFGRHFHRAMQFALAHPDLVHKNYAASAGSWTSCLTRSGVAKCFSTKRRASPP